MSFSVNSSSASLQKISLSRSIAWDGICFQVPETWFPGRLGKGDIGIESAGTPLFEAKWSTCRPQKSLDQAVREIRRRLPRSTSFETHSARVWPFGVASPTGFDAMYFAVDPKNEAWELGVVLCCRRCGRLIVLQSHLYQHFFEEFTQVFSSITDMCNKKRVDWVVYDIRAQLDPVWALSSCSFAPGRFELQFVRERDTLRLYRFAPADVVLRRLPFDKFVKEGVFSSNTTDMRIREEGVDRICIDTPRPQGLQRVLAKIRRRASQAAVFWHVASANKILGVYLSSRREIALRELDAFVTSYETF